MYALNKRFRLTEYWGMSTLTIGCGIGGIILLIVSVGMWVQANKPTVAGLMVLAAIACLRYAYTVHLNNQFHRINSAIAVGKRDVTAKSLEIYFD